MKRFILPLLIFFYGTVVAQNINVRKLPKIETADDFKTQTLVIIKLTEDAEKVKKLSKKDPETCKVYQESIRNYNNAAEKFGTWFKGIFSDKKLLTIDEITAMKESEITSFAFLFPYINTTGGTSYYEEMTYNLYKKEDWLLLKDNFAKITDFSMLFNKGIYEKGGKKYFQWGLFSRITTNGKSACNYSYAINFPQTERALSEADLYYLYKTTTNVFNEIIKERHSDPSPSNKDAELKSKTLYVCETNLGTGFDATTLKAAYKGKVEVLLKDQFDTKLLAGEDALFLVVYPYMYVKGLTAVLAKLGWGQIIIDGKTLQPVKNYVPNKVVTGKMENISFDSDYEKITAVTAVEYNKSF